MRLVRKAYEEHDFKRVMAALLNFCSVDLSAVYFDIRKDSLYCDAPSDVRRRSARTVMAAILERLLAWLAPIMPFTTEENFPDECLCRPRGQCAFAAIPGNAARLER